MIWFLLDLNYLDGIEVNCHPLYNGTHFDKLSDRHREILYLYEKALADFDTMKEKQPLPYRTAFSIQTSEDLISFVKQLDIKIKQECLPQRTFLPM